MATSEAKTKKYKLFSSADGTPKPCAFFSTPEGCRAGDKCRFLHTTTAVIPDTPTNNSNSVVSSEESDSSDSEAEQQQVQQPKVVSASDSSEQKRKRKNEKTSNPFAGPSSSGSEKKFKYTDLMDDSPPVVKHQASPAPVAAASPAPAAVPPPQKKQKKKEEKKTPSKKESSSVPLFKALNLPVAEFMLPSGELKKEDLAAATKEEEKEEPAPTPSKPVPEYILPVSTEAGRKWKDLVAETQAHPNFVELFGFAKYKEDALPGEVWVKASPYGKKFANNPQAIAIDCEMCETKDPLTGKKNHNALCRISIVNANDPEEVLLNTLVKPDWPVTDYRTWINGIKKEHLDPVQFTMRHAQAFMTTLCSEETVIMGHAVHNDLAAMRMDHFCCADSALLFKAKDSPTATVSLKDLAMAIMKKEMPETHDSVNDARTALICLDHYRQNEGKVEEIVRTPSNKRRPSYSKRNSEGGDNSEKNLERNHHQLFVHRIPRCCNETHIAKMILEHTAVAPDEVGEILFSGSSKGKSTVIFKSPRHAFLAFDTLKGTGEPDKSGRLQKKVFLRDGDYVRIRKMAFERGHKFSSRPSSPNANEN